MRVLTFDHDTPCVTVFPAFGPKAKVDVRRLQIGESVRSDIGPLTLLVARLASSGRIPRAVPKLDSRFAGVAALVTAVQLSILGWAAYSRPPTAEVTQRLRVGPLEVSSAVKFDGFALPEETAPTATRRDIRGQQKSREGLIGLQPDRLRKRLGEPHVAAHARRRVAMQGPVDNPDPHVARREGDIDTWPWGIGWDSHRYGESLAPLHPSGRDTALGTDDFSARAPHFSGQPDPSHGNRVSIPAAVTGHLRKTLKLVDVQPLS